MNEDVRITGTLIWYYFICKREVWLMAHNINADQENEYLDIGRFIHENAYSRDKKEITFGNIKVDILKRKSGQMIVGEVKKSSKAEKSAKMQLLYYLRILHQGDVNIKGVLLFPEEKKKIDVELDDQSLSELNKAENHIRSILKDERPPKAEKINFCKNCAYAEFCWS